MSGEIEVKTHPSSAKIIARLFDDDPSTNFMSVGGDHRSQLKLGESRELFLRMSFREQGDSIWSVGELGWNLGAFFLSLWLEY